MKTYVRVSIVSGEGLKVATYLIVLSLIPCATTSRPPDLITHSNRWSRYSVADQYQA